MLNFFRYLQLDYQVKLSLILYYRHSATSCGLLPCQHGLLSIVHLS